MQDEMLSIRRKCSKASLKCTQVSRFGSVVVDFLFIVTAIVGVCNCSVVRYFMSILVLQSS